MLGKDDFKNFSFDEESRLKLVMETAAAAAGVGEVGKEREEEEDNRKQSEEDMIKNEEVREVEKVEEFKVL